MTATCLVVIGASAGGPSALATILKGLPQNFPAPIVIVQHVHMRFAEDMARWLGEQSSLPVNIARDGDEPQPGTVLLAATDDHLVFGRAGRLHYVREPRTTAYRPSVDVFFESVAKHWHGSTVGVVLTGMGRDGAAGLRALRDTGAATIAQDRDSSVVYGMPRAAAELNAASEVVALESISQRLVHLVSEPRPRPAAAREPQTRGPVPPKTPLGRHSNG